RLFSWVIPAAPYWARFSFSLAWSGSGGLPRRTHSFYHCFFLRFRLPTRDLPSCGACVAANHHFKETDATSTTYYGNAERPQRQCYSSHTPRQDFSHLPAGTLLQEAQ